MKKIISFSLWGDNVKYCGGAIRNAQLAYEFYRDWECWFYYDDSVPLMYISILNSFDNCRTIHVGDGSWGAFWRFAAMQPDTIVLSRDTDSRLSLRERRIVDEWLLSDAKLCTIRDHAAHYEYPILAGMWGLKGGLTQECHDQILNYSNTHVYLQDQIYLQSHVWPLYTNDSMVRGIHETAWMQETYNQTGWNFIGQAYDNNDKPIFPPEFRR
jgi:hypothetical protein